MTDATLDVLLVEDNPGFARLVEELLGESSDLLHRIDLDGTTPGAFTLHHADDLAGALDHLASEPVDVVVLDLGLPDSRGLETLDRVVAETQFTPVVVLTGLDDRDRGIKAIQSGAEDYLVKDEVQGDRLVHAIQYALGQAQAERERVRHRERLEALNDLNEVTQAITHDVITTSTREDLERAVCDRLVDHDAYRAAWVGAVDTATGRITTHATAHVDDSGEDGDEDDHPEELTPSADDTASEDGPVATAARTGTVQVVTRDEAADGATTGGEGGPPVGWRSLAAVPLGYRSVCYGVLVVYADDPDAFGDTETTILGRVGDVVGHAVTAIERREALVRETALQLEFATTDVFEPLLALTTDGDGTLTFESVTPADEGTLVYGRADGVRRDALAEAAAETPSIRNLRVLSSGEESYEFELDTTLAGDLTAAVASHGGYLAGATVEDGASRFVLEFPPGRDVPQVVALVQDHWPTATPTAQRTVDRDGPDGADSHVAFKNRLTAKQQAALEAAFRGGYFDWPRETTGEEVAERLGVTQATFSQHLRAAERAFFDAVFERDPAEQTDASPWTSLTSDANSD